MLRLLHTEPREPDDAVRAVIVARERRQANTTDGALAIQVAIHNGFSWRELSRLTGYAVSTLRDWAKLPASEDEGDQ